MMQGLDIVDKFIKERFTKLNNANMHGLQSMHRPLVRVSSAASSVACPVGKVVIIALGNSSELERTSCVDCRAGSYYNRDSQTCETCQEGSFQNRTGQLSCEPCPAGKWSVGGHAKNFTECIVICEPGEYTMHRGESGIINCLMCPIGTYQPKYRAKKCEPCPSGKTTAQKASTSINDCV
ncbi:von Willebrand factor type A domain [Desmophyllum pertusum]|uniref:von Willebrand factor type A domain n=1 Tax=Desmophyllum pertusum TaxID=174260 RepID=A0A9X0A4M4_9CNID|nr:von Willebrand factor type A domain [Desmophyllum pertusum]